MPTPYSLLRQAIAKFRNAARCFWARWRMANGITPLSYKWGADRGLPVHRYYVDQFLTEFASDIQGHCLEFQDPQYAPRFGGSAVTLVDEE
jgi:hypothetical protein